MSWDDKINNVKFAITTGDGKVFYPLWKPGTKSTEFNTSIFDFIDVPGSLADRKQPKGSKFPLTFWFQGADNIEQAEDFEKSAKDNRAWIITHPFYGTIKGQPVSIERNDENYNITEIIVEFWESIDADYPNSNYSVKDNTFEKKTAVLDSCVESYASQPVQKPADISKNRGNNAQVARAFEKQQTNDTFADYQNAFATAQKATDKLLTDPSNAISKSQALLDLPSTYETPVLSRAGAYLEAFSKYSKVLITLADKYFFQSQGAATIASYCNAAVNPIEGDYTIVPEVSRVSTDLVRIYREYVETLDSASVSGYNVEGSWHPDATVQSQLQDLVLFTISNLFNLGFDSQQERIVYTDRDTNFILLTHQYLGLDATDASLDKFRTINNIRLNELFKIKKGRKIKYYV